MSSDELPMLSPEEIQYLRQTFGRGYFSFGAMDYRNIYGSEKGIKGEIQSPIKTKVTEHRLESDKTIDGECSELKTLSNPILKLDA